MDLPDFLLVHTIGIEPYAGTTGYGVETYGASVDVDCFVEDKRQRVRSPATGEYVISEATVIAPLDTVAPVGSRATLPDGRVAIVLVAKRRDGGGLPTPDHLELNLT